jgi:2-dehydropantoate 2-reductase
MKKIEPNYLILGTGALGSIFGGFLQESGCNVTFVGRGDHFKAIVDKGLKMTGIWGEHYIPADQIKGYKKASEIRERFSAILLCVKSMHTDEASSQAAPLLEDDGIMVSIQNGLNNWETMAKHVGGKRIVGGRVIFGAAIPEPGLAKVTVIAEKVLLGEPFENVNRSILEALDHDLNKAGIPTALVSQEEIRAALWAKVLYNSSLNPLSAILGVSYGELGESGETQKIMKMVMKEIFLVMEKKGIRIPFKGHEEYYRFFLEKLLPPTASHHSSMLQDISRGKQTEIAALNGAISKYARELGIETPYNDFLASLIRFKEHNPSAIDMQNAKI